MKNRAFCRVGGLVAAWTIWSTTTSAQLVVWDPGNYVQAVARYLQLVKEYTLLVEQTRRLPGDLAARYRVPRVKWRDHNTDSAFVYARPYLAALNSGDRTGVGYFQTVDPLTSVDDVLSRVPDAFRRRLLDDYATIELGDSAALMGINQAGELRTNGATVLKTILAMEDDAVAEADDYHTQTALLDKISGATVLGLRIGEGTSQFMLATLEQLLVQNKRMRDAESGLMNAHLYQWRYGREYGDGLFRNTAQNLDQWRLP